MHPNKVTSAGGSRQKSSKNHHEQDKNIRLLFKQCVALTLVLTAAYAIRDDGRPNEHFCPITLTNDGKLVVAADAQPCELDTSDAGSIVKIPQIALGYEAIYERFLMSKLVYRP